MGTFKGLYKYNEMKNNKLIAEYIECFDLLTWR